MKKEIHFNTKANMYNLPKSKHMEINLKTE